MSYAFFPSNGKGFKELSCHAKLGFSRLSIRLSCLKNTPDCNSQEIILECHALDVQYLQRHRYHVIPIHLQGIFLIHVV